MFSTCRGHAWLSSGSISQKSAEIPQSQLLISDHHWVNCSSLMKFPKVNCSSVRQNSQKKLLRTRLAIVKFNFSKVCYEFYGFRKISCLISLLAFNIFIAMIAELTFWEILSDEARNSQKLPCCQNLRTFDKRPVKETYICEKRPIHKKRDQWNRLLKSHLAAKFSKVTLLPKSVCVCQNTTFVESQLCVDIAHAANVGRNRDDSKVISLRKCAAM